MRQSYRACYRAPRTTTWPMSSRTPLSARTNVRLCRRLLSVCIRGPDECLVAEGKAVVRPSCSQHDVENLLWVSGVAAAEPGHIRLHHGPVFIAAVGVAR